MTAKVISLFLPIIFSVALISCQLASPTPLQPTSTIPGQMETRIAANSNVGGTSTAVAMIANQTSTAVAKLSPFYAARTADAMTAVMRTPHPTESVFNIYVPASACWMNSKINVRMGQRVIITASGIVNTFGGRDGSNNEPDGQKGVCGAIQCPLQGTGYGALIGRVEDEKPFYVGTNLEFVPINAGQLYFTVNDWECDDNSGTFKILVTLP